MKFTVLQENLSKGLNTVSKAIPTKSALPILSNVLITAETGRVKLSATNFEIEITTYIGASTEEEGATTIPAKLFKDFVSNISPSSITANLKDDILHVQSDKSKSKFNGVSAAEYPPLHSIDKESPHVELDPKVFANAVSAVAFAAATDESRPVFTGIFMSFSEDKLTLAASDGFRLSEKVISAKGINTEDFSVIVPAKTLAEVARIVATSTEPLKFVMDKEENLALFECSDTFIATRIIDGQYPDYKRIIPTQQVLSAQFSGTDLLEVVKLTNIFISSNNTGIKINFLPEGKIKVTAATQEIGEHQSEIPAEIEGEELEISFNSRYLLDFLNNVKSDRLVFVTNGKVTPCLIKPADSTDFLHIIMPLQS